MNIQQPDENFLYKTGKHAVVTDKMERKQFLIILRPPHNASLVAGACFAVKVILEKRQ